MIPKIYGFTTNSIIKQNVNEQNQQQSFGRITVTGSVNAVAPQKMEKSFVPGLAEIIKDGKAKLNPIQNGLIEFVDQARRRVIRVYVEDLQEGAKYPSVKLAQIQEIMDPQAPLTWSKNPTNTLLLENETDLAAEYNLLSKAVDAAVKNLPN